MPVRFPRYAKHSTNKQRGDTQSDQLDGSFKAKERREDLNEYVNAEITNQRPLEAIVALQPR
jgi:hypothetical protein